MKLETRKRCPLMTWPFESTHKLLHARAGMVVVHLRRPGGTGDEYVTTVASLVCTLHWPGLKRHAAALNLHETRTSDIRSSARHAAFYFFYGGGHGSMDSIRQASSAEIRLLHAAWARKREHLHLASISLME